MNIIDFIRDENLIGGTLSPAQETALRLLYGLPLSESQRAIAREALDRAGVPEQAFSEGTFICGRRSGKSDRIAGNIAVFEAAFGGHEENLAPGERGHVVLIAQDKRAARILYRYILAKLEGSPMLSTLIQDVRAEEIDLTNRLTISILPCSFRATRGFSIPVAILDEVAFFRHEGAIVDKDVIDALRPAQATFPRPKLIKISSPYAKSGELYKDFASRASRPDLLCFRLPTWKMNPTVPQKFLDSERVRDPDYFDREYGALFTDAISSAFSREIVESCVVRGRYEIPPSSQCRYTAFVDPSGGSSDSMTLAIASVERRGDVKKAVLHLLREARAPFNPDSVVQEFASDLKRYGIHKVVGDRYGAAWVSERFRFHSIRYEPSDLSRSEIYLEALPSINTGEVELLDNPRLIAQLVGLERKTSRSGRDSVDHAPGGHDDVANAAAGALVAVSSRRRERVYVY